MPGTFEGKVALVTGAGYGMGRAGARLFAREGARVVVSDIDPTTGEDTVRQIREAGGEAIFVACDVSRAAEVEAMVSRAVETYGRLDCAYNNAGISGGWDGTIGESEEEFDRVIAVNLKGVWLCMKYEIPVMLRQGGGAIVNTASVVGLVAQKGTPAYVAAKHGVIGLTQTAALEHSRHGIRVNAVCPGPTRTGMMEGGLVREPGLEGRLAKLTPAKRIAEPEEVAVAVVWLCSDAASYVMGHAMVVDGGVLAY
jgi:NAD(P)-dependent dehydrogenase (short-subunit alcohol dehydrogenase family)